MAIARGAGTEIIRCVHADGIADTARSIIFGVQHHIYTVLSIIVHADSLNASGDYVKAYLQAYDINGGTSGPNIVLFRQDMSAQETFVWNDKFSFNGHEPTDFTALLDSIVKQDAIADQGGAVQKLFIQAEHGSDNLHVHCTFIDQNNA